MRASNRGRVRDRRFPATGSSRGDPIQCRRTRRADRDGLDGYACELLDACDVGLGGLWQIIEVLSPADIGAPTLVFLVVGRAVVEHTLLPRELRVAVAERGVGRGDLDGVEV